MGLTAAATGADQLARTVTDAGREIADLTAVHRTQGEAALAAAAIPVRTGRLAESAAVVADDAGFALVAGAPYASYVHAVDPFFTTALARREDDITRAVEHHVETALDTIQGA